MNGAAFIKESATGDSGPIVVRLAQGAEEIAAAQRLRYRVFYEEYAAEPDAKMLEERRDISEFDPVSDHLVVLDMALPEETDRIVGTYRLLRQECAERHGRFYSSDEYDITPLLNSGKSLLELGRSCVLSNYRTRPVLQKLWEGIAHYVTDHGISLMFGCASLHGTNPETMSQELAYLYHYHLAPENLRPRAVEERYVDMNMHAADDLDARKVFASLPPLIKGYIRLGASIGDGAVVDHQFNTTDVCIVMPTHKMTERYANHYERVTRKSMPDRGKNASGSDAAGPA